MDRRRSIFLQMFSRIARTGLKLNPGESAGVGVCVRLAIRNRALAVAVVFTGVIVALLEGSTIGILVLAINVLVGNQTLNLSNNFGGIGSSVTSLIDRFDRDIMFLMLVIFAVVAQVAKSGMHYLSRSTSIRLGTRVSKHLQEQVTRQITTLSYLEIGNYASGSLNEMLKFSSTVPRTLINTVINKSLLSIFLLGVYLSAMLVISVPLTLLAVAVSLALSLSLTRIVKNLEVIGRTMTEVVLSAGRVTVEYLNAPRLIRIFGASGEVEKKITRLRGKVLLKQQRLDLIRAGIDPAIDATTIVGIGVFIIVGFIIGGDSVGEVLPSLVIFLFILNRMLPHVKLLNSHRMIFASSRRAVETLGIFLKLGEKEFIRVGGIPFSGLRKSICLQKVCFGYPGTMTETIKDLDFCIEKGQMVALVGLSGAGKSTISNLILGLHRPNSGNIVVDGIDLEAIDNSSWLGYIGVVDQEMFLINESIRDNICFTRIGFNQADVERAARIAHAHEFICQLDSGYDTIIGDRGYKLSGGQQQRLALARALLTDPEILILDEATSSLDSESETLIQKALKELHRSRTMLIIAHRLSTVAFSDQILVIERGQIIEQGTKDELLKINGRFSDWWRLQSIDSVA